MLFVDHQSDHFLVLVSTDIPVGQPGTWLNGRWDESVRDYAREVSLILGIQPDYTIGNGSRCVQVVIINDIQSFPYILFCRDKIYLHRNYINAINHQSYPGTQSPRRQRPGAVQP